jgi:hypothetical protein
MNNRTIGIIATVASALICGCASIFACVWGVISVTGTPIDVTNNGQQSIQTVPPAVGAVMLCLSVLFIATPIVIGFVTLRKKPTILPDNEPIPPAS